MRKEESNLEIKKYLQARKEIAILREKIKQLDAEKDARETLIVSAFKEEGMKKKVYYGKEVSLNLKKDVKIYDEDLLLKEFSKRKDMDYIGEFTSRKINALKFKKFAKKLFGSKKELLPGTEYTESEGLKVMDFLGDIINI